MTETPTRSATWGPWPDARHHRCGEFVGFLVSVVFHFVVDVCGGPEAGGGLVVPPMRLLGGHDDAGPKRTMTSVLPPKLNW